jgi:hypothetical protein
LEGHPEIGKRLHIEYFYNEESRGIGKRAIVNDDFKAKHAKHGSGTAGTGGGAFSGIGPSSKGESSKGSRGFSGFGPSSQSQGSSSKGSSGTGTAHQQVHGTAVLRKRDGTPYTPAEAKKYAENLRKFDVNINTAVEDDGPGPAMEAWSKRNPKVLLGSNQNYMLGWLKLNTLN